MINRNLDYWTDAVVVHCNATGCQNSICVSHRSKESARETIARHMGWSTIVTPRSTRDFCPEHTAQNTELKA